MCGSNVQVFVTHKKNLQNHCYEFDLDFSQETNDVIDNLQESSGMYRRLLVDLGKMCHFEC